jgi:hypothetical protein
MIKKWAKDPNRTFLKRQHINSKQIYDLKNQWNSNQNHNKIPDQIKWWLSKRQNIRSASENVEKREIFYTNGGNVNEYNYYGKKHEYSSKT